MKSDVHEMETSNHSQTHALKRHTSRQKEWIPWQGRIRDPELQMTLNASTTHQFQHAVVASTILHVQEDVFVALAVPAAPDGTAVFQDRLPRRTPQ